MALTESDVGMLMSNVVEMARLGQFVVELATEKMVTSC